MIKVFLVALLTVLGTVANARNKPGDFDFYVLALSWSPSFCAAEGNHTRDAQCTARRPYAFVVHGLWPQYEQGFPEFCDPSAPRVPQRVIDSLLDIMPSPRLVIHQWVKHGRCAGTAAADYFATLRAARERVRIPDAFAQIDGWKMVSPEEVERAFLSANPGLDDKGIAVTCDDRHLREVRVCLTRDLEFRSCPEVDRRACRTRRIAMPPSRQP